MANTMSMRFETENDAPFKKNLDEIASKLKVNYAQMGLLTAQYDSNATSQEALRAKSDALRAAMENQRAKVQLLSDKMKDSTSKTGEGSTATLNYQTSLTKAETELAKMQNQLNGYDKSMQSASKSSTSMADVANGLTSTLGVSLPPAMQGCISKLDGVSASGAAAVGVIASLAVGLGKLTIDTAKTADNLLTLSSTTGLSTDELQEYEYAAELVDVSSDTMQSSMTKMIKSMSAAKDGTGDAAEAYKELKIKVTDSHGALKDANTVFYQAIDALGKVKNETERDALSMSIFGKSARDLNPLIEAGSGKLKELGEEAHNVGYVMDNETLQQFGQLDDAMQRMEKQGDALKNSLALAMLPILTALFETIGKIPVPVLQTIIVLVTVITTILLVIKAIKDVTSTAGAIKGFLDPANAQMLKTTGIILGIAAAVIAVLLLIAALTNKTGQVKEITSSIGESMNSVTASTASVTQNYPRNARGSRFWVGGTTTVGEEGPEIVTLPRGSRIYPNGQGPKQSGGNTTNTYYVTIDAKNVREFNDVVAIAQNEATSIRQGVVPVGAV